MYIYIYIYIYIYMSAHSVRSLCTVQWFNVKNYNIIPRAEIYRLYMADRFNKNEMNIYMQFLK